jgi:hypothetical protein
VYQNRPSKEGRGEPKEGSICGNLEMADEKGWIWPPAARLAPRPPARLRPTSTRAGGREGRLHGKHTSWIHCTIAQRVGGSAGKLRRGCGWLVRAPGPQSTVEREGKQGEACSWVPGWWSGGGKCGRREREMEAREGGRVKRGETYVWVT